MSLIRKHGAVLQAWACLDLVVLINCINYWLRFLLYFFHRHSDNLQQTCS